MKDFLELLTGIVGILGIAFFVLLTLVIWLGFEPWFQILLTDVVAIVFLSITISIIKRK